MTQKIAPHLWYDKEAKQAAELYVSVFPNSKIKTVNVLEGTPSGSVDLLTIDINGYEFSLISAGPYFKLNPSISFMVNFDPSVDTNAEANLNKAWDALSPGGIIRMPIQEYPFSKRYGWVEDKFGVSWQLMLTDPKGEPRPFIIPSMMFVGANAGKAEEATKFYMSIFKNSKRGTMARYPGGMEPEKEGTLMFTDFMLENQWFAAMDSANKHEFNFNEAVSLQVFCDTQEEIDYYWGRLSAVSEAEQCGWLKDVYGVSWQIVPTAMNKMMREGSKKQIERVTKAFLQMKKFNIAELEKAFQEK